MSSLFAEAVRRVLERDLVCPKKCGSENVPGQGGQHIELEADGVAVCHVCGS